MIKASFRRRTGIARFVPRIALVLVAFNLLTQVVSFAHLAYVNHVTCAEHGELVEVGRSVGSATAGTDSSAVRPSAAAEESHGHDHCVIALARRDRAFADSTTRSFVAIPLETPLEAARAPEAAPPAIAVILIAPKNSPPV